VENEENLPFYKIFCFALRIWLINKTWRKENDLKLFLLNSSNSILMGLGFLRWSSVTRKVKKCIFIGAIAQCRN
jgi:hypothetical protein